MKATAYFVGNLTRDPELRQTGSGTAVANFDLAINSKVGDDEQTDYFSFVAWRKTAEFCQKYLRKGMKVTVSAQPKTREYEDKNGNKRKVVEFWVNDIDPHSWERNSGGAEQDGGSRENKTLKQVKAQQPIDEDLPF